MDVYLIADKLEELGVEGVTIKGSDVMARCPFHPDRSPSFGVHPENGANCFACMVKFRTVDKLFRVLSEKNGVPYKPIYTEIPFDYDFLPEPEEEVKPLNKNVLKFYKDDPEYFVEKWGVSLEVARARQLKLDPYSGSECFPIIDFVGNYWGCVERTPPSPGTRSRYHYPPGYPRRNILLGEDRAERGVWVVEGVRDLCAVETKTGQTAVALGGAKASKEQVEKLKRFQSVTLALDNDKAGIEGRNYLIKKLMNGQTFVAKYKGKDPMDATSFDVQRSSDYWLTIG